MIGLAVCFIAFTLGVAAWVSVTRRSIWLPYSTYSDHKCLTVHWTKQDTEGRIRSSESISVGTKREEDRGEECDLSDWGYGRWLQRIHAIVQLHARREADAANEGIKTAQEPADPPGSEEYGNGRWITVVIVGQTNADKTQPKSEAAKSKHRMIAWVNDHSTKMSNRVATVSLQECCTNLIANYWK